jgi:hypothetical protein
MMEETQRAIMRALGMSSLDRRLRVWREDSLRLFEEIWSKAARSGSTLGEHQVADLYGACFVHLIGKAGISIPPSALLFDEEIARLTRDILQ